MSQQLSHSQSINNSKENINQKLSRKQLLDIWQESKKKAQSVKKILEKPGKFSFEDSLRKYDLINSEKYNLKYRIKGTPQNLSQNSILSQSNILNNLNSNNNSLLDIVKNFKNPKSINIQKSMKEQNSIAENIIEQLNSLWAEENRPNLFSKFQLIFFDNIPSITFDFNGDVPQPIQILQDYQILQCDSFWLLWLECKYCQNNLNQQQYDQIINLSNKYINELRVKHQEFLKLQNNQTSIKIPLSHSSIKESYMNQQQQDFSCDIEQKQQQPNLQEIIYQDCQNFNEPQQAHQQQLIEQSNAQQNQVIQQENNNIQQMSQIKKISGSQGSQTSKKSEKSNETPKLNNLEKNNLEYTHQSIKSVQSNGSLSQKQLQQNSFQQLNSSQLDKQQRLSQSLGSSQMSNCYSQTKGDSSSQKILQNSSIIIEKQESLKSKQNIHSNQLDMEKPKKKVKLDINTNDILPQHTSTNVNNNSSSYLKRSQMLGLFQNDISDFAGGSAYKFEISKASKALKEEYQVSKIITPVRRSIRISNISHSYSRSQSNNKLVQKSEQKLDQQQLKPQSNKQFQNQDLVSIQQLESECNDIIYVPNENIDLLKPADDNQLEIKKFILEKDQVKKSLIKPGKSVTKENQENQIATFQDDNAQETNINFDNIEFDKVINFNVNNNGNYALVQLKEQCAKNLGLQTITAFTPLKDLYQNQNVEQDLQQFRTVGDIIYVPRTPNVIRQLQLHKQQDENQ